MKEEKGKETQGSNNVFNLKDAFKMMLACSTKKACGRVVAKKMWIKMIIEPELGMCHSKKKSQIDL
jgi:hypothetical protein